MGFVWLGVRRIRNLGGSWMKMINKNIIKIDKGKIVK